MRKYIYKILFPFTLILFLAFNFQGNPPSGWYQQFLPDIGSTVINDMQFLDSLTGYMVTSKNVNPDMAYILKTTDGGDSWNAIFFQNS